MTGLWDETHETLEKKNEKTNLTRLSGLSRLCSNHTMQSDILEKLVYERA